MNIKHVELNCPSCHNNFKMLDTKYQGKLIKGQKNIFCSQNCYKQSRPPTAIMVPCFQCKKEFLRKRSAIVSSGKTFCSQSCGASWNNKGTFRNPKRPRICSVCGVQYYWENTNRTKYCDNCHESRIRRVNHNSTLKEMLSKKAVKGKHPSWKSAYVRTACHSLNRAIKDSPCQFCGYATHTELCHIKPVSSFDESATLNEVNHPDNILVLCPNHHWEFDNGKILLGDIPKRIS